MTNAYILKVAIDTKSRDVELIQAFAVEIG